MDRPRHLTPATQILFFKVEEVVMFVVNRQERAGLVRHRHLTLKQVKIEYCLFSLFYPATLGFGCLNEYFSHRLSRTQTHFRTR